MTSMMDASLPCTSGSSVAKATRCCFSVRFARTMRWAIAVTGRWNPRAISCVVRPATIRSVSATCPSVDSSGWQHMATSRSRSSAISGVSASGAAGKDKGSSGRTDAVFCWARSASRTRLRARLRQAVISQAPGRSGTPSSGHRSSAASSVSCTTSSAVCRSPTSRSVAPMSLGHSSRNAAARASSAPSLTAPKPHPRSSGAARSRGSRSPVPSPRPAAGPPRLRWPGRRGRPAAPPRGRPAGRTTAAAPSGAATRARPRARSRRARPRPAAARPVPTARYRPARTRTVPSSSPPPPRPPPLPPSLAPPWLVDRSSPPPPLLTPGGAAPLRLAHCLLPHGHDLADLNRAELGVRALRRDRHGRLDVGGLDDEVPGNDLLGLGERPVEHALLPVAGADLLRLRDRAQRRAALERAVAHQAHGVLADALHGLGAPLLGSHHLGVLVQDQHELHRYDPPPLLSLSPLRHRRDPGIDIRMAMSKPHQRRPPDRHGRATGWDGPARMTRGADGPGVTHVPTRSQGSDDESTVRLAISCSTVLLSGPEARRTAGGLGRCATPVSSVPRVAQPPRAAQPPSSRSGEEDARPPAAEAAGRRYRRPGDRDGEPAVHPRGW